MVLRIEASVHAMESARHRIQSVRDTAEPASNVVDVYVGYLRKKIDEGHTLRLIHTHRGLGYSLGTPA